MLIIVFPTQFVFTTRFSSVKNAMSIAQSHTECYLAFRELCNAAQKSECYHRELLDEFDKYCLWAGNVGAAHSGKTEKLSLDYRLREASSYKDEVPKLYHFCISILAEIAGINLNMHTRLGQKILNYYKRSNRKGT
jgi:hypothetical protein